MWNLPLTQIDANSIYYIRLLTYFALFCFLADSTYETSGSRSASSDSWTSTEWYSVKLVTEFDLEFILNYQKHTK